MDSGAVYNFIDEIDYTEDSSYKRDSSSTDIYITLSFFKGAILTQSCHYQYSAETMTSPEDLQMRSDVFNHKVAGYFIITITTNMSITSRIDTMKMLTAMKI